MTKRAAIYARISRDIEGTALGVDRQIKLCRDIAKREGWSVAEVYRDNDVSATGTKPRPDYRRLVDDLRRGAFDVIVALDTDRLLRKPGELEELFTECEARGVRVRYQSGGFDPVSGDGMMEARIRAAVDAEEVHKLKKRVRRKSLELAEAGTPAGGGARPFGYDDDRVTIRKSEAVEIRRAVRSVIGGGSFYAVAADWNARGVTSPSGRQWSVHVVKRLLTSPRIAGRRQHQGADFGPATWPGIITPEDRALLVARGTRRRTRAPHRYLLSGMIEAADGTPMVAAGPSSSGVRRYKGGGSMIAADPVEVEVAARLLARLDTKALAKVMNRGRAGDADRRARDLVTQIQAADAALERITDLQVEGVLSKADAGRRRSERQAERDALSAALAAIDGGAALPVGLPSAGAEIGAWWDAADITDRRRLLGRFIERVVVAPASGNGRHAAPAETRVTVRWRS